MAQQERPQTDRFAFFTQRWRREVPLSVLFWRDMIVVGSAINLVAALVSLMLLAMKADLVVALLIFFAPMPYNIFLVACVWRTADVVSIAKANFVRMGATLWLIAATVI